MSKEDNCDSGGILDCPWHYTCNYVPVKRLIEKGKGQGEEIRCWEYDSREYVCRPKTDGEILREVVGK